MDPRLTRILTMRHRALFGALLAFIFVVALVILYFNWGVVTGPHGGDPHFAIANELAQVDKALPPNSTGLHSNWVPTQWDQACSSSDRPGWSMELNWLLFNTMSSDTAIVNFVSKKLLTMGWKPTNSYFDGMWQYPPAAKWTKIIPGAAKVVAFVMKEPETTLPPGQSTWELAAEAFPEPVVNAPSCHP
ncbi:MAG: hypothetical protein HKL80_03345 [Acidimicrobiales bacterium]|nr:hypothetical protein [Acidimicrobiales bacterium]